MSRADKMKNMDFPDNSKNLIVIRSNLKGTGFLRGGYN